MDVLDGQRAIDATLPQLRDRIPGIDRAQQLPDDPVEAVRRRGLNRALLPSALDGLQAPVVEAMDLLERIAAIAAARRGAR
jgi:hypothetical protein